MTRRIGAVPAGPVRAPAGPARAPGPRARPAAPGLRVHPAAPAAPVARRRADAEPPAVTGSPSAGWGLAPNPRGACPVRLGTALACAGIDPAARSAPGECRGRRADLPPDCQTRRLGWGRSHAVRGASRIAGVIRLVASVVAGSACRGMQTPGVGQAFERSRAHRTRQGTASALDRSRTCNLDFRRVLLSPVELPGLSSIVRADRPSCQGPPVLLVLSRLVTGVPRLVAGLPR